MKWTQLWLGVLGELTLAALFVGLVVRGRVRRCYSFALYVLAVLVTELMITLWPGKFLNYGFWLPKEILLNALKYAIALELAARTLKAFPGARATARGIVLLVVVGSLAAVLAASTKPGSLAEIASQLLPRILNSTIWLFTALAVVILWYRLPVDLFHKAILVGFVPYLLVFTAAINALNIEDPFYREVASYSQSVAYLALLGFWTHAAWRRQEGRVGLPPAAREAHQHM